MPKPIQQIQSSCVPLGLDNVDTDQIIPARFLKGTSKEGFGEKAFYDLRYEADGAPNLDFVLNDARYAHAKILVAGHNFGCGSSREHAPWALVDYGFQAVIAISFADIFKNNAMKNGLLPIELSEAVVLKLLADVEENANLNLHVHLDKQCVDIPDQEKQSFEINSFWKHCLLEGLDQVGYTLSHANKIDAYEANLV